VVHDEAVISALDLKDKCHVQPKFPLDEAEEVPEGVQPFGLKMRERRDDLSEDGVSYSNIDLGPCHCDPE
jgi:hypothetical protein